MTPAVRLSFNRRIPDGIDYLKVSDLYGTWIREVLRRSGQRMGNQHTRTKIIHIRIDYTEYTWAF